MTTADIILSSSYSGKMLLLIFSDLPSNSGHILQVATLGKLPLLFSSTSAAQWLFTGEVLIHSGIALQVGVLSLPVIFQELVEAFL